MDDLPRRSLLARFLFWNGNFRSHFVTYKLSRLFCCEEARELLSLAQKTMLTATERTQADVNKAHIANDRE
jgi:hypothetical protein